MIEHGLDHLAMDEDVGVVARHAHVPDFAEEPGDGLGRVGIVVAIGDVQLELEGLGGKEVVLPGCEANLDRFLAAARPAGHQGLAKGSPAQYFDPVARREQNRASTGTKLRQASLGFNPEFASFPLAGWT